MRFAEIRIIDVTMKPRETLKTQTVTQMNLGLSLLTCFINNSELQSERYHIEFSNSVKLFGKLFLKDTQ